MSRLVVNWRSDVGGVQVYHDMDDERRLYYVPSQHWSELTVRVLGDKATLLVGEVAFDLTPAERAAVLALRPNALLAPISIAASDTHVHIEVPVAADHVLNVRVIPQLPFPKILFNATVRHGNSGYEEIIDRLRAAWSARSIFSTSFSVTADSTRVHYAYGARLQRDDVLPALRQSLTARVEITDEASARWAAADTVTRCFNSWAKWRGPGQFAPAERRLPQIALGEAVFESYFTPAAPLLQIDSGRIVRSYRLRDRLELVDELVIALDVTERSSLVIRPLDPA